MKLLMRTLLAAALGVVLAACTSQGTPQGSASSPLPSLPAASASPAARLTLSPDSGPIGSFVRVFGTGFDPALEQSPPVFFALVRDFGTPVTCEFIGGASVRSLRIDPGGHLMGSFVVTGRGDCNQSPGKHHATAPGRYSVNVGCVACTAGSFHVIKGRVSEGATCSTGQLKLGQDTRFSEETEQRSRAFTLTNTSSKPCHMQGYPQVVLLDAEGSLLPFSFRDGGDQMITSRAPRKVILAPGETAYFMFNKNECVPGGTATAASARITLPGADRALSASVRGAPLLLYCGPGHAGHVIAVSPIEPTLQRLFPQ